MDESGLSFPENNASQGFFALGGVAIDEEEGSKYCQRADDIKVRFFGRKDFAFHEPAMRHRKPENRKGVRIDYSFGADKARQEEFDKEIGQLLEDTQFVVFGVGIRKEAFREDFVEKELDPYLPTDVYSVALTFLLERFVDYLAHSVPQSMGRVTLESIGSREDAFHQLQYARLLLEGSQWVSDRAFQARLETGLRFSTKSGSSPAELADVVARDLFEWVRSECKGAPKWWEILCSKVYVRGDGLMGKFGIKVFPDADIRDRIEEHRRQCGAMLPPK